MQNPSGTPAAAPAIVANKVEKDVRVPMRDGLDVPVDKLNAEVNATLSQAEVRELFAQQFYVPAGGTRRNSPPLFGLPRALRQTDQGSRHQTTMTSRQRNSKEQ